MKFRWTIIGALTGLCIWLVCYLTHFELLEHMVQVLERFESWEADEVVIVFFLILGGLFVDHQLRLAERDRQIEINRERIRMHQVTMRNVLDIVGNFLHHLQMFTLEAEKSKGLTAESIASINEMLFETSDKLQEIADLEKLTETESVDDLTLLDLESKKNRAEFL